MDSSQEQKKLRQQRKLQLEVINVDAELEHIARLYPNTRQAIDRARDLLGRYIHMINGVDIAHFCNSSKENQQHHLYCHHGRANKVTK